MWGIYVVLKKRLIKDRKLARFPRGAKQKRLLSGHRYRILLPKSVEDFKIVQPICEEIKSKLGENIESATAVWSGTRKVGPLYLPVFIVWDFLKSGSGVLFQVNMGRVSVDGKKIKEASAQGKTIDETLNNLGKVIGSYIEFDGQLVGVESS